MDQDLEGKLEAFRAGLAAATARERDHTASEMGDWFEFARDLPDEVRARLARLLIDAASVERDDVALESILNAIGAGTTYAALPSNLPWDRIGGLLARLQTPLLEYGIGILRECGDPKMAQFLHPYTDHDVATVKQQAREALVALSNADSDAPRCACVGCSEPALPDGIFCPFCEDQHTHTHE